MGIVLALLAPIMAIVYPFLALGGSVILFVQSFIDLFKNLFIN